MEVVVAVEEEVGGISIGIGGIEVIVGAKVNVSGRRRLAGGEKSSGNDLNVNGDEPIASIRGKALGDVSG